MSSKYPRHQSGSIEVGEPNEQDVRIGIMKNQLRLLMGDDEFKKFYVTTSMDGDLLEFQLRNKLETLRIMHEGAAGVAGLSLLAERKGVRVIYGRDKKELLGL